MLLQASRTPRVFTAWTVRAILLFLHAPVLMAQLFVRSAMAADQWSTAQIRCPKPNPSVPHPNNVVTMPPREIQRA